MKPSTSSGKWPVDRQERRFVIDLRLVIKPTGDKAKTNLHGRTKNMSESGLAATVAGDLELGEVAELQFQLPATTEPMTLRANVRYRQGSQYGFNFLGLSKEQAEKIRRALIGFPIETADIP